MHEGKDTVRHPPLSKVCVAFAHCTDKARLWDEIFRNWNEQVLQFAEKYPMKQLSACCVELPWTLVVPHSNMNLQETSQYWSSTRHLGHLSLFISKPGGNLMGVASDANRWPKAMPQFVASCPYT